MIDNGRNLTKFVSYKIISIWDGVSYMTGIKIKGSVGRIIIMLLVLSITIIGGTFAWFTYRSRESALV